MNVPFEYNDATERESTNPKLLVKDCMSTQRTEVLQEMSKILTNERTKSCIHHRSVLRKSQIGQRTIGNFQIIPSKSRIGQWVSGNCQIRPL